MNIRTIIRNKIDAIVRRSYWFNEILFPECKKFWYYNCFDTNLVNLGSTSALYAFCYEDLPIKAANWALRRNPLLADQAVLYNYSSFLNPNGSTVILSLCPFTSLSGCYDYFEDRYYTILRFASIPHASFNRRSEILNMKKAPMRYYPLYSLKTDLIQTFKKKSQVQLSELQMEQDADRWINSWLKEFSIMNLSDPLSLINKDGIEDAARILNEIIFFCKERNYRPVLLIPPVYHTLSEKFTSEFREKIIDSLINKIEDKSIYFHNYMNDAEFTNDITLFRNSYLMNVKGAKLFTRRVLKDLNLIM